MIDDVPPARPPIWRGRTLAAGAYNNDNENEEVNKMNNKVALNTTVPASTADIKGSSTCRVKMSVVMIRLSI